MNENRELIDRALDYARSEYHNGDLTLQDIAEHAGFSIDYFNRIFCARTGFTVMAYVNHLRLKHGALLLRKSEKSVLDIALEIGYDSHEGFTKAFRKHYGMNPSDYREKMKDQVLTWGDLTDPTAAGKYLHDHPGLTEVDLDQVIDDLLEKDSLRYGYLCAGFEHMGWQAARDDKGNLFLLTDDRQGGCWVDLVTEAEDFFDLLAAYPEIRTVYSPHAPKKDVQAVPVSVYTGEELSVDLPEDITVRPLNAADIPAIAEWAEHWTLGRQEGFVRHLLSERDYLDDQVLEFGIFRKEILLAAVGCGIDCVRGSRYNACALIRFRDGEGSDALYRAAYASIVNQVLAMNIVPADDAQYGDYARSHGNFTALEMGFEAVLWRYTV